MLEKVDYVELQALAIIYFVINRKHKMPEQEAKGEALYLAHVMATKEEFGWSGVNQNPQKTAQVIPTKIYAKDGVFRVSKTFHNVVMNEDRYRAMVEKPIGAHYLIIMQTAKALLGIGSDPIVVKDSIKRMITGETH